MMASTPAPHVSVLMPVHNGARYLRPAIASVLQQTFTDFELVAVDDASTDDTPTILMEVAADDQRIRVVSNPENLGLTSSLNIGLRSARGSIIARMDSDDVCAPNRLAEQIGFLAAHPDHLVVGSGYRAIDHAGNIRYTKINPLDAFAARWLTRFRTPMAHPSICFRAALSDGTPVQYDESFPVAQDFDLIARLARVGLVASLGAALIDYRVHSANVSARRKYAQNAQANQIAGRTLAVDLPPELAERLEGFLGVYFLGRPATPSLVAQSVAAFDAMIALDAATEPDRRSWLMRQTAGLLAEAFLQRGGGFRNPAVIASFARHASHYLPALVGRVLENTGRLPARWLSYPEPAGAGA